MSFTVTHYSEHTGLFTSHFIFWEIRKTTLWELLFRNARCGFGGGHCQCSQNLCLWQTLRKAATKIPSQWTAETLPVHGPSRRTGWLHISHPLRLQCQRQPGRNREADSAGCGCSFTQGKGGDAEGSPPGRFCGEQRPALAAQQAEGSPWQRPSPWWQLWGCLATTESVTAKVTSSEDEYADVKTTNKWVNFFFKETEVFQMNQLLLVPKKKNSGFSNTFAEMSRRID